MGQELPRSPMLASGRNHYQARSPQLQSQGGKTGMEETFGSAPIERDESNI